MKISTDLKKVKRSFCLFGLGVSVWSSGVVGPAERVEKPHRSKMADPVQDALLGDTSGSVLAGHKYIFTYPSAHPLKLSRTVDGGARTGGTTGASLNNDEYTTGVTIDTTLNTLTLLNTEGCCVDANLYYYCASHENMGGVIYEENGLNNIISVNYNTTSTVPQLELTRAHGETKAADTIQLSDSFVIKFRTGCATIDRWGPARESHVGPQVYMLG